MSAPSGSRLIVRHLAAIVLVSVIFTTAATMYQVHTLRANGRLERDSTLTLIERSYLPPLAAGLFFFDDYQIQLLGEGIILLPHVVAVSVFERQGEHEVEVAAAGDPTAANGETHRFPLVYRYQDELRHIGSLQVTTSMRDIHAQFHSQLRVTIVTNLLKIFGFAVVVLVVAQRMIFRHLSATARFLRGIDPGGTTPTNLTIARRRTVGGRADELDEITDAINTLLRRTHDALQDRAALLHELFHRTGNMMQNTRAILKLQSARGADVKQIRAFVRAVDNRILAMALAHQKLYQSGSLSRITMRGYLTELAGEIVGSYRLPPGRVRLVTDIDDLPLLIDSAVPCGLLVSELLSNSLQHAFPDGRSGTITITFHRGDENEYRLTVSDDGVGVHRSLSDLARESTGIRSVVEITARQLNGTADLSSRQGARWSISFSEAAYQERVHIG